MSVIIADHGEFDQMRKCEAKTKNMPNTVHVRDWIDIWDPVKSKDEISDEGCIGFYLDDSVCECPKTYLLSPCPQPTQETKQ